MRILPCGTTAILVEVADLEAVLGLYAALAASPPPGVVDIVPAARTVLLVIDPGLTSLGEVEAAVRATRPRRGAEPASDGTGDGTGDRVDVPVAYDGEDLDDVARLLGWDAADVVRRHADAEWTVAFSGFAPGFGYLVSPGWPVDVPRRSAPRTRVPSGAVGLAGQFSGVYPRESPGGWQLIGRTAITLFDPAREPAALLRPGTRVRFVPDGTA